MRRRRSRCSSTIVGDRDGWIDPVQLQQVDPLDTQVPQVQLDLLPQIFGAADGGPHTRPLPGEADLGGDDQVIRVGMQGPGG